MRDDKIVMAHGGGGVKMHEFITGVVLKRLGNDRLDKLADSAVLDVDKGRLCFTTDGFVVQPLEFPGGDIGRLAVCGTVNDLAVMGAVPIGLSLSLIIEEGLSFDVLERVVDSIAATCEQASVKIVTGDTKVIQHSRGDGLMVTTSGVGVLRDNIDIGVDKVAAGDKIIFTGNIAEHGLAIMSVREGLAFKTTIESDAAPLNILMNDIFNAGGEVKFMRDPTRSGLAGVLADIVDGTGLTVEINEADVPITAACRHTAELLGLDPLTVANEGKCVIVVGEDKAEKVLGICRENELGKNAAIIGSVVDKKPGLIEMKTRAGGKRVVQRPYGEELPRIC